MLGAICASVPAHAIVTTDGAVHSMPSLPAPDLSGVGRLGNGCSAVLLRGGTHVLGAAHCHEAAGGHVRFESGVSATISEVTLAPGWAGQAGVNDLALMTLAEPIKSVAGYAMAPARAVGVATVVLIAGWGASGDGQHGADTAAGRPVRMQEGTGGTASAPAAASAPLAAAMSTTPRYGYNEYDALLPPVEVYGNRVFMFDFDDGTEPHNVFGRRGLEKYEAMLAPQDSGGPSFVAIGNQWQLAGIHVGIVTNKGTGYGGVGLDLRVAPYVPWITRRMGRAP